MQDVNTHKKITPRSDFLVARYLEVGIFLVFFQLLNQFLDITGDLVTASDEEGVIGIDNDEVFDADGRYEAVFTLDKEVFAP